MAGHKAIGKEFHALFFSAMFHTFCQYPEVNFPNKDIHPLYRGKGNKIDARWIMKLIISTHPEKIAITTV